MEAPGCPGSSCTHSPLWTRLNEDRGPCEQHAVLSLEQHPEPQCPPSVGGESPCPEQEDSRVSGTVRADPELVQSCVSTSSQGSGRGDTGPCRKGAGSLVGTVAAGLGHLRRLHTHRHRSLTPAPHFLPGPEAPRRPQTRPAPPSTATGLRAESVCLGVCLWL